MIYRPLDSKNPHPKRQTPRIIERICNHLGSESRYEIREYPEDEYSEADVEADCEDQDHCDLFGMRGCPVTSWVEYNQGICEDCGETGANCKCGQADPRN